MTFSRVKKTSLVSVEISLGFPQFFWMFLMEAKDASCLFSKNLIEEAKHEPLLPLYAVHPKARLC